MTKDLTLADRLQMKQHNGEHEMETGTPKRWRDMTPEEKGALLLAWQEGKLIEFLGEDGEWRVTHLDPVEWRNSAYRVRPEPKRETVDMFYFRGGEPKKIGTINLIDGKPDPDSIKIEPIR